MPVYQAWSAAEPGAFEALFDLGLAYDALERLEDAVAVYRAATELDPTAADAHLNLGLDLLALGRQAPALAAFERYLERAGEWPQAERVRGIVAELRGRLAADRDR